jgi:hypothetical protein
MSSHTDPGIAFVMGSKFGIVIWSGKRFVDHTYHKVGSMEPRTLEFAYVLDFSIFASLHAFFGISFYKIGIYDLDLV